MKSTLALTLGLLTAPLLAPAQSTTPLVAPAPRGTLRLEGRVLDAASQQPVPFATVALLPAAGTTTVDGAVADEQGRFVLKSLPAGDYQLRISFIGYATLSRPLTLSAHLDLGTVSLASEAKQLGEVTVTGERPVVESKPDRLVYNAAQDATNRGGTAADVLRKAPMVSVDPDGNLQLRGSGNVQVLINGRPSAVMANGLADALRQLPADQIKSVEVITSPSAKYDSEGSAGIINIVLKENTLRGTNGNLGLALGSRTSQASAGLNLRGPRLALSSSLSGMMFYVPGRQHVDRYDQLPNGGWGQLTQRATGKSVGGSGNGRVSLDYDAAPHHALNLTVQSNLGRNRLTTDVDNRYQASNPALNQALRRDLDDLLRRLSYDVTGAYTRTFADSKREWTVLAQHARSRSRRGYVIEEFAPEGGSPQPKYTENSLNRTRNLETTLQTDYVHPLTAKQAVEVGSKLILRQVHSDFETATTEAQPLPELNGSFRYGQRVLAGYATWSTVLGSKYSVRLGGRAEHTDVSSRFQDRPDRFADDYLHLLPNVALSRSLRQPGAALRLSYARRLQRPSLAYLNPFVNRLDARNVQTGTPSLDAETTDHYELNWNTFVGGSSLNVSSYVRHTPNAIEGVRTTDAQGITTLRYANVAANQSVGLNLSGSVKPLPNWDVSGNFNGYYSRLRSGALGISNDGLAYSASLNSGYKLQRGLSVQFFGQLNSPRVQLQGRLSAWSFYALGLRQQLLKGQADLTLNADNVFRRYYRFVNDFSTAESTQRNHIYAYNRGVRLAFSYRFGKLENKPARPRRSIRNDDQKAAESTGQGN